MSSFKILVFSLIILLSVQGCGFSPLYSTSSNQLISAKLKNIQISNISNQNGQFLRNLLLDSFYSAGTPTKNSPYRLEIKALSKEIVALGIKKDASATRAQMRTDLTMILIDQRGDESQIIFKRDLRSINSFNILESQYSTKVSEKNIEEQSLKDLSDQIVIELALYFKNPRRVKRLDK